MGDMRAPAPPELLEASGRKLWRQVQGAYQLRADEEQLLLLACRAADVCNQLAAAVEAEGLCEEGSQGRHINVMLAEWRAQALLYARLVSTLRLPDEDEGTGRRPQRRGAARGPQELGLA